MVIIRKRTTGNCLRPWGCKVLVSLQLKGGIRHLGALLTSESERDQEIDRLLGAPGADNL